MPISYYERGNTRLDNLQALSNLEQRFAEHLRHIQEESALVLIAHLQLERLVHEIQSRYFGRDKVFQRPGFATVLELLRAQNIVKPSVVEALSYVNQIRNGFAHQVTDLDAQIVEIKENTFRNSCSALSVQGFNRASNQERFILWTSKLYVELTKSKFIAGEMNRVMMTIEFIDLFTEVDVSTALTEPGNQF